MTTNEVWTPDVGFHEGIDEASYHGDRTSLSVSGAKLLLKAPALYRYRLDNPEQKPEFDFGSAAHMVVLGVGPQVTVVDATSWMTKDARAQRDEARAAGRVPVLYDDWQAIERMAEELARHPLASRLLVGKPEISAYAYDEAAHVMRRGRFDVLGGDVLVDYKTTTNAEPSAFAASCARYGYDMQADWYLWLAAELGEPREAFAFIAQEKSAPYLVEVYELDSDALDRGYRRNRRALDIYRQCRSTGEWPGITGREFTTLNLPRWAYAEDDN